MNVKIEMVDGLMSFSEALKALKSGKKIRRHKWKPESFIFLVPASSFVINSLPLTNLLPPETRVEHGAHIDCYLGGGVVKGWAHSDEDLLAYDWVVLP